MLRVCLCLTIFAALSACSSGGGGGSLVIEDATTTSAILAPGTLQERLSDPDLATAAVGVTPAVPVLTRGELGSVTAVGGLVEYALGVDTARQQVVGLASIRESSVGAPVTGGTARYTTNYTYAAIDNVGTENITVPPLITNSDGALVRTGSTEIGLVLLSGPFQTVDLEADFDAGTVRGSNSEIAVNGTVSGAALGGQVTVVPRGGSAVDADLAGDIGANGLVGAFAGHDADTVVVGGLVGQRRATP